MVVVPACQPMKSSGPVRQFYAGVIFIPQVRDYELGYCLSYSTEGRNCTLCTNCKLLRSPGMDSKESILPAYLAWWAGTSNMGCRTARQSGNRWLGSLKGLQIRALYSVHCTPTWDYSKIYHTSDLGSQPLPSAIKDRNTHLPPYTLPPSGVSYADFRI
jgi:hypothetical protein